MIRHFLRSRLERFRAHYREGGLWRVLKLLAFYGCAHGWALWLADMQILGLVGPVEPQALDQFPGYSFGFATEMDIQMILSSVPVIDRSHLERLFRRFFHDGSRCVIALFGSRVVGYMWAFSNKYVITLDDYRQRNLCVWLPSGAVFTGNAYVMPPHRGRGLFQRMKLYLMHDYPVGTNFYTSISDLNTPSLAANHKLGFRELATLRFVRVFSRTLLYVREKGERSWRPFRAGWPEPKLDGTRLQMDPAKRFTGP